MCSLGKPTRSRVLHGSRKVSAAVMSVMLSGVVGPKTTEQENKPGGSVVAGPTLARAQEGELPAATAGLARVRVRDAAPSCLRPTWASLVGSVAPGPGRASRLRREHIRLPITIVLGALELQRTGSHAGLRAPTPHGGKSTQKEFLMP